MTTDADGRMEQQPAVAPNRRPLYLQVKELMIAEMTSGTWSPGQMLPSEMTLADKFQVSQGTVRKALDALEAQKLVLRRQGRGTFVTEHSRQHSLFHFFRIKKDRGDAELPTSIVFSQRTRRATRDQAEALGLERPADVEAIVRVRYLRGRPVILERIFLPSRYFTGLALPVGEEMTEELYVLYQQQFRITIVRAQEALKAVAADAAAARHLGVDRDQPMLEVRRVAHDLSGRAVELRISHCDTRHHHYTAELD